MLRTSVLDIGHNILLAFLDFRGLDLGPYAEVLGGLHHIAISVEPGKCDPTGKADEVRWALVPHEGA